METYPLILDGQTAGEVCVFREGGWTVFEAKCAAMEGVVRISVYGGGREGYLGVLAPDGEGLSLRRRLSRSALADFPAQIEYAARAGLPCEAPPEPEPPEPEAPQPEPEEAQPAPPEPLEPEAPQPAPTDPPQTEQTPPGLEDVYWYASPDGALVCFDGEHNLIALPVGDARIPDGPGGWPKTVEGRDYIVYRTRDGRLLR